MSFFQVSVLVRENGRQFPVVQPVERRRCEDHPGPPGSRPSGKTVDRRNRVFEHVSVSRARRRPRTRYESHQMAVTVTGLPRTPYRHGEHTGQPRTHDQGQRQEQEMPHAKTAREVTGENIGHEYPHRHQRRLMQRAHSQYHGGREDRQPSGQPDRLPQNQGRTRFAAWPGSTIQQRRNGTEQGHREGGRPDQNREGRHRLATLLAASAHGLSQRLGQCNGFMRCHRVGESRERRIGVGGTVQGLTHQGRDVNVP